MAGVTTENIIKHPKQKANYKQLTCLPLIGVTLAFAVGGRSGGGEGGGEGRGSDGSLVRDRLKIVPS